MDRARVEHAVGAALRGRRLLDHPFYRRWEAGTLAPGELAAYAEQYRTVERALPSVLAGVVERLPQGAARDLAAANLADELSVPEPHADLFESFARAVGARGNAPATPATERLVALQGSAAAAGPATALAVLAAYEVQAAEVAVTKSAGLARHYGVDAEGTRFWDVHAGMEADHAGWSLDALAHLGVDAAAVGRTARDGACAWWGFLDEREALAPAAVPA